MLPLRYPWLWWALGWIMVAGISVGSLIPGEYVPTFSLSDKILHAGAYALLMLWFGGLYRRERHWQVALFVLSLGIVLDVAQSGTATRHFDPADLVANASGILAAFVLLRLGFDSWCRRIEQVLNF